MEPRFEPLSSRQRGQLTVKIASESWEFACIDRLNYRTFVEEISQHQPNSERRLTDRFHKENTYIICVSGRDLLGMVSVRGVRPFSLDGKLKHLDAHLPIHQTPCEIRLLSIATSHRRGAVLPGLMRQLYRHCLEMGYDLAVISGTVRQLKLYTHLGFVGFGPLVGHDGAWFQPMYVTRRTFEQRCRAWLDRQRRRPGAPHPLVNLLPGPVAVHPEVHAALQSPAISHRSARFVAMIERVRRTLCRLTRASFAAVFAGSGTLANDVIAAQLARRGGRGLILSNGEFGERLVKHARGFGLAFDAFAQAWGQPFNGGEIARRVNQIPDLAWLWVVHAETSTGVLNDLDTLKAIASARNLWLCLDGVSSIGCIPVNLDGVAFTSCVSGKGLRAVPGLAIVFHQNPTEATSRLPRSLDLGMYATNDGLPFTISSHLLTALDIAVRRWELYPPYAAIAEISRWLRASLLDRGFNLIAPDNHTFPAVITIALPHSNSSMRFGRRLDHEGFLLSYRSSYLAARNWIQICLMGECSQETIVPLLEAMDRLIPERTNHV